MIGATSVAQATVAQNGTTTTEAVGTAAQRTTSRSFHAVGNLLPDTDGRGDTTTYTNDALGRRTATQDPLLHGTGATFEAVGDALTATDAAGKVTTFTVDPLHRRTAVTDPLGHTTTGVLDARGAAAQALDGRATRERAPAPCRGVRSPSPPPS